jgi:hypothetical protein
MSPLCSARVLTSPPSELTRKILFHGVIALKLFIFDPFIEKHYHVFIDIPKSCILLVHIRYMHCCFSFWACQDEKRKLGCKQASEREYLSIVQFKLCKAVPLAEKDAF